MCQDCTLSNMLSRHYLLIDNILMKGSQAYEFEHKNAYSDIIMFGQRI